jgi:hypothetical protein
MFTGRCRSQFLPDGLWRFKKTDGVVHRLGHLYLPIGPKDPGGPRN